MDSPARMRRGAPTGWRRKAVFAMLPLMALGAGGANAPTGGQPDVRAFVLSNIFLAAAPEDGVCEPLSAGGLESFLASLSPKEQSAYASPAQRPALERLMGERLGFRRLTLRGGSPGGASSQAKFPESFVPGTVPDAAQLRAIGALNGFPKGRGKLAFQNLVMAYDSCTDPQDFRELARGFRPYDGNIAFGMNLDGKVGSKALTGPDGEAGVDNQLWRAIGCVAPFRESGNPKIAKGLLFSARAPTLIAISGIDDIRNDPDVMVSVMASTDPVQKNAAGSPLARATFDTDPDPALRATTHGRIVDGVLTTDPVDIRLNYKEQIIDAPRLLKGARIRATLHEDGSIEGGFYGYYTLTSFYESIEQMTVNGANLSRLSCPGVRLAIDKLADGYRDPKTGRFTAISSALGFFGVAAFINDPSARNPGATAGGNTAQ